MGRVIDELCMVLVITGSYKAAENLSKKVVKTKKRMVGEEHPDTLTSLANLASTFWNQS